MISLLQMIFSVSFFFFIFDKKKINLMRTGALTLNLNRLYKPAKVSDGCTLQMLNHQSKDEVSIFEIKRLKGWWPCVDLQSGTPQLTVNSAFL